VSLESAIRYLAVLSAGLTAGILFGDRMGATFARRELSPSSFVSFQQTLHQHFVPMMPILMIVAILASSAWLILNRSRVRSDGFAFLALAVLANVGVLVLTRLVNVPINHELMSWDAAAPPADVMAIWARWEQAHTLRTGFALLGFALELLAFQSLSNGAES
jgi:uncharacterized membrane protein